MTLPRPISPGQIYRGPITDGLIYYYISDMVTRQRVMSSDTLSFKVYRMLFNNNHGFVYKKEDIQHMEHSVLRNKLNSCEYVKTIRQKLDYEQFVDMLTEKSKRIAVTTGISMSFLSLILLIIWVILKHG